MAVAVIDIGKTNAKVALVDVARGTEIETRRVANAIVGSGLYPHYDVERLWNFILESLAALAKVAPVEAISTTTHGATAALLDADGRLALPILDYECVGPEQTRPAYDVLRPAFEESGSPRLPNGLNLGAQLHWQQASFPADFARVERILTYPQYWGFRLTGVAANEVTSLGCHTDLWSPARRDFSSMVDRFGWRRLFAPIVAARSPLGSLLPEIARRTRLPPETPVLAGIHDSNASLLPQLLARRAPFTVLSTGTWVVALAVGAAPTALDPARDTLINVDAFGDPVPSSRFMGGRENQVLAEGLPTPSAVDVERVLAARVMYLPAAQSGSGPFPKAAGRWLNMPATPGERRAAVSFYLALMSATCLDLVGARGPTVVEGPFAGNPEFAAMLGAATAREVIASPAGSGTSIGAALLAGGEAPAPSGQAVSPGGPAWESYATAWRDLAGR